MKINNKTDFTKTLNLPKPNIAIKSNQVKKEEYILNKIQDEKKFKYVLNKARQNNAKRYKILELPTDIENKLSSTIILNKILKDFVIKSKLMSNEEVEHELMFTNAQDMEKIDVSLNNKSNVQELIKLRQQKRKELDNNFKGQIIEIDNLGTSLNYERNTLTTIKTDFEIEMIKRFYELYKEGLLKKEISSVHWCTECGSLKRRKDLKFIQKEKTNYYVLYKVVEDKEILSKYKNLDNTYFIATTMNPWTMASSDSIAISDELEYSLVEITKDNKKIHYIIASEFVDEIMQKEMYVKYSIKQTFKSDEIINVVCMNPLDYRKKVSIIVTSKEKIVIDKKETSGIRIVSSGHTYIDFLILKDNYSSKLKSIIDEYGKTNGMSIVFQNMKYTEVNDKIIEYLNTSDFIYTTSKTKIKVPTCDKCSNETVYRCINDWYIKKEESNIITDEIKERLVDKIHSNQEYKQVELLSGISRINNTKQSLISDKNIMSTPIPVFYCADCGANVISEKIIDILSNIIKNKGTDFWYKQTPEEILQGQEACKNCGCTFFFKENATLNYLFKYICINLMQKENLEKQNFITNILIESKNEFITNLNALSFIPDYNSVLAKYDKILVHSSVKEENTTNNKNTLDNSSKMLDINNKKQSNAKNKGIKKKGFFLFFGKSKRRNSKVKIEAGILDTVSNYGTDILRLWAAYFSNRERIGLNSQTLKNLNKRYKNIRKTFRYILANLYDFNPNKNYVQLENRNEIDIFMYNKLFNMAKTVKKSYNDLEFNNIYKLLTEFCENTLCGDYFDSIKYKMYILNANDKKRRAIQSNIYDILLVLCNLWYPIIPFTIEEIWPYIYHKTAEEDRIIFSSKVELKNISLKYNDEIMKYEKILSIKKRLDVKLRAAIKLKMIKNTLEAKVIINTNDYTKKFIDDNLDEIVEITNVSEIETNVKEEHSVKIEKAAGEQCVRCKHYSIEIGKNLKYRYLCPKCADILEENDK